MYDSHYNRWEDLGKEEMQLHRDQLPDPPSNWKEMMKHYFQLCQLEIPITRAFYGTRIPFSVPLRFACA